MGQDRPSDFENDKPKSSDRLVLEGQEPLPAGNNGMQAGAAIGAIQNKPQTDLALGETQKALDNALKTDIYTQPSPIKTDKSVPELIKQLGHAKPQPRNSAREILASKPPEEVLSSLKAARSDKDAEIRARATELVGLFGQRAVLDAGKPILADMHKLKEGRGDDWKETSDRLLEGTKKIDKKDVRARIDNQAHRNDKQFSEELDQLEELDTIMANPSMNIAEALILGHSANGDQKVRK